MAFLALLASIVFISDAQVDVYNAYPESVATIVAAQIGDRPVYDCGDLAENGLEPEYDVYASLFPQTIPVPGNHDYYTNLAYYPYGQMVDVMDEGIHLVGIDTALRFDSGAMAWLGATLDDGDAVFTIFFNHYQLYSDNLRNGGVAPVIRASFLPLLDAVNVDLVICGHGHAYERHEADGRTYLVIGGAGAHLDDVGSSATQIISASVHHWLEITRSRSTVDCLVHGTDGGIVDGFSIEITTPTAALTWGRIKQLYR